MQDVALGFLIASGSGVKSSAGGFYLITVVGPEALKEAAASWPPVRAIRAARQARQAAEQMAKTAGDKVKAEAKLKEMNDREDAVDAEMEEAYEQLWSTTWALSWSKEVDRLNNLTMRAEKVLEEGSSRHLEERSSLMQDGNKASQ